jgi:hypothetical protein
MDQTQDTEQQSYSPGFWDIIKRIVDFLNHDDALSLNQTCKTLRKHVPHKCLPSSIQVINVDDLNKLKNRRLELSEVLMLNKIPLNSELIDLIRDYCPKLKYLFIKYNCEHDVLKLDFENLPCVGIFIKISMLYMDSRLSICNLSSTVENFTAHISEIDPVTFKIIPGEYEGTINLNITNLENLKSL